MTHLLMYYTASLPELPKIPEHVGSGYATKQSCMKKYDFTDCVSKVLPACLL